MRFGICSTPDQAAPLADVGYDYVEWPLRSTVGELSDTDHARLRVEARDVPVAPEAWNVMLPGSIQVVGPEADLAAMGQYLERALSRAAELGGQVVVFGSGGSRRAPEGWSRQEALDQLAEACARAGDIARRCGLTIALEPLNSAETNLVNTVAEAMDLARRVAHPAVKVLSDLYHVALEAEPFEATTAAGQLLAHVHIATPADRTIPLPDRTGPVLRDYFLALRRAGYDERISIECRRTQLDEAAAGLRFIRQVWSEVQQSAPSPQRAQSVTQ